MTQQIGLFRTSVLSGIENVIKLFLGLAIIKMVASYYGPEGMALFGQFQNVYAAAVAFSSGMLVTGLVRYTSQYKDSASDFSAIVHESFFFSCLITVCLSVFCFVLSGPLSRFIFLDDGYSLVFKALALFMPLISFNFFVLSVMNGLGHIRAFVTAKICVSFLLLIGSVISIFLAGIETFFAIYVVLNALGIVFVYRSSKRFAVFDRRQLLCQWRRLSDNRMLPFWLMAVVGVVSTPLVLSVIRRLISQELGLEAAGYWDAITRLTEVYLVVITGAMLTYYIPNLGCCSTADQTRKLVYRVCLFAVSVSLPVTVLIYFFRDVFIQIALDASFLVTRDYFLVALLGSIVKIVSWVFSYYVIARSKVYAFLIFELSFGLLLVLQTKFFIPLYGLHGVFYASLINAVLFCVAMYLFFLRELRRMKST